MAAGGDDRVGGAPTAPRDGGIDFATQPLRGQEFAAPMDVATTDL